MGGGIRPNTATSRSFAFAFAFASTTLSITNKDTRTYCVPYSRSKLSELEDPDTISVVVWLSSPPRRRIFCPGRLQHKWLNLGCLSVREGRGETSVPVIFSQDCGEKAPPHIRLEQLECSYLWFSRSWGGQEFPLVGLYNSKSVKFGSMPPLRMNPNN